MPIEVKGYQVEQNYGAVPLDIEESRLVDSHESRSHSNNNRNQRSGRDHMKTFHGTMLDKWHVNSKCFLATVMLSMFISLIYFSFLFFTNSKSIYGSGYLNSDLYDYIIVGAGPAGSVIANKLLSRGAKVLLLG